MKSHKKFRFNSNVFTAKMKGIFSIFLLTLFLSSLAGCGADGGGGGDEKTPQTASVSLNISLPQSHGRSLMTAGPSDVRRIIATIKNGPTTLRTIDSTSDITEQNIIGLPAGDLLTFSAKAFDSLDGSGDPIFIGSINKVLIAGVTNDVNINMTQYYNENEFQYVSIVRIEYPATIAPQATREFTFYFQGNANQSFSYHLDSLGNGSFDSSSGNAVLNATGEYSLNVNYTAPDASGDYPFKVSARYDSGSWSSQDLRITVGSQESSGSGNVNGELQISFPPVVKSVDINFNQYENNELKLTAQTDPATGVNYSWQTVQGTRALALTASDQNQAYFNGYNPEATLNVSLTVSDESNDALRSSIFFSLRSGTYSKIERSSWQTVGGAAISDQSTDETINLVVDNNNIPYVAYNHSYWTQTGPYPWEGFRTEETKVMNFISDSWQAVGSLSTHGDILNLPDTTADATVDMSMDSLSLAIGGNGVAYLAYQEKEYGPSFHKATVIKFNGVSWEHVGTARASDSSADALSLAISENGTVFLAYKDGGSDDKAIVKKFIGGTWQTLGGGPASEQSVDDLKLVLDNETPYLAYSYERSTFNNAYIHPNENYKRLVSTYKAEIKKFNDGSWETLGVLLVDMDVSGDNREVLVFDASSDSLNLAIDNGVPYFAYNGGFNRYMSYPYHIESYKAKVKKFDGDDWVLVGDLDENPDSTTDSITARSLSISETGVPYLAYTDDPDNNRAGVKKFNGYYWEQVGAKGQSEASGDSLKIDIDSSGVPYIAYQDSTGDVGVTVKKFDN